MLMALVWTHILRNTVLSKYPLKANLLQQNSGYLHTPNCLHHTHTYFFHSQPQTLELFEPEVYYNTDYYFCLF